MLNSRHKIFLALFFLALLFVGIAFWHFRTRKDVSDASTADYKNATYDIFGDNITLSDGKAEMEAAPGSASMITTEYFGDEAHGDLNGDGKDDVAFLLTQDGGGTGVFFYVVAALDTGSGYVGTNAVLLGDRISPQSTEIKDGEIIVNYAERGPNDPMTADPSVAVSKYLKVSGQELVEVK